MGNAAGQQKHQHDCRCCSGCPERRRTHVLVLCFITYFLMASANQRAAMPTAPAKGAPAPLIGVRLPSALARKPLT
jgi:hypothetical protein